MAEIGWTDEAQRWLTDIFEYIAADNPQAAVRPQTSTLGVIHERASGYPHKAVIYRVNCSNYRKRFEQWEDQLVAIFATAGESNRLEKGCGNKVSRKGKFGLRHDT
jgi:plasmid stabilization system protein ParE